MKCLIEGKFLENKSYKNKDGKNVSYANIYSGGETIRINQCSFECGFGDDIKLNCDVRSTQYGLMITPCDNES